MPDTPVYLTPEAMAALRARDAADRRRLQYDEENDVYVDRRSGEQVAGSLLAPEARNAPTADLSGLLRGATRGLPAGNALAILAQRYLPEMGVTADGAPDIYGPAMRTFARALGSNEDEAARWAAANAVGTRNLLEFAVGPESFARAVTNAERGQAGWEDYLDLALTAAPGPIGKGVKRFVVDPLRRGASRIGQWVNRAGPLSDLELASAAQRLYDEGASREELEAFLRQNNAVYSDPEATALAVAARDAAQRQAPDFRVSARQQ